MIIACEFRTSGKNTRYFFIFGMVFNDRTIFSCSSDKSDFSRAVDIKGVLALAILSGSPFELNLFADVVSICSPWDVGVLTPISATLRVTSTMAFSMRFSRSEKMWVRRCLYDSEFSIDLMRARESFEDLEKRYNTRLTKRGARSGIATIMMRLIGNRNCKAGGRRGRRDRRALNHSVEKVVGGGDG